MSGWKEIVKIRAEINEIEFKYTKGQWIHELVLWEDRQHGQTFNQTHQEKKREDPKKYNQKWKRKSNNRHQRNTVRKYYEQLHANKLDNLDKMDKFLET